MTRILRNLLIVSLISCVSLPVMAGLFDSSPGKNFLKSELIIMTDGPDSKTSFQESGIVVSQFLDHHKHLNVQWEKLKDNSWALRGTKKDEVTKNESTIAIVMRSLDEESVAISRMVIDNSLELSRDDIRVYVDRTATAVKAKISK